MYKVEYMDEKPKLSYAEGIGEWGQFPTPYRESTAAEFWRIMTLYTPEFIDYNQIAINGRTEEVRFYYFPTCAFAVSDIGKGDIKYWKIGCEHEWEEETVGHCLHKFTCKKCGFVMTQDSSD